MSYTATGQQGCGDVLGISHVGHLYIPSVHDGAAGPHKLKP